MKMIARWNKKPEFKGKFDSEVVPGMSPTRLINKSHSVGESE